jgi:hypothetical protein
MPHARHAMVPGEDTILWAGDVDPIAAEIEAWLRSQHPSDAREPPTRCSAAPPAAPPSLGAGQVTGARMSPCASTSRNDRALLVDSGATPQPEFFPLRATVERLLAFAEGHPVTHLLGGHIEMTRRPGVDYAIRTTYQPEEPPLELSVADLRALRQAVETVGDAPGVHPFERFVLYHGIPARHFDLTRRQLARRRLIGPLRRTGAGRGRPAPARLPIPSAEPETVPADEYSAPAWSVAAAARQCGPARRRPR